jgi:hypothetical protein
VSLFEDHRGGPTRGSASVAATGPTDPIGLRRNTITNWSVRRRSHSLTVSRDVLTREGVEFIDETGGGAGLRLRKPSKKVPNQR